MKRARVRKLLKVSPIIGCLMALVLSAVLAPVQAAALGSPLQQAMQNIVSGGFPGAWIMESDRLSSGAFDNDVAAAGIANLGNGQPTRPDMKMRIGSVTKSFTGAVVLQLVDENKLSLNDTLEHWVPGLLPYGSQVKIKQLLNHTSGIPDYLESGNTPLLVEFIRKSVPTNPEYDPTFKNKTWTPEQLIARIASEPRHQLPPNQAEYSDSNYVILGMVIKAVTHQSVQTEVQSRFISPLGLSNTSFPTTSTSIVSPFAHGYSYNVEPDGNPIVGATYDFTNYNPSFLNATGAMISNPQDMNKFMSALLGGRLLSSDLTTQMKQTVPITLPAGLFPSGFGAGLGIWSWNLKITLDELGVANTCSPKKTIYGHEGETPGYDTWSFGDSSGNKTMSMGINLMVPDWNQYYAVELPQYALLWCN